MLFPAVCLVRPAGAVRRLLPLELGAVSKHTGCHERTYRLLCSQEINFSSLPPGDYLLTLCRPQGRQDLWVHLSPGSNVECRFQPHTSQWHWRRLSCHCAYKLT